MTRRTKIILWCAMFVIVFLASALIRVRELGSAPMRHMKVEWNDNVGTVFRDQSYRNDYGHKYDLYIPAKLNKKEKHPFILYIHGGSFNSGSKEDGETWCKYYTSKGYITASMDYSLQKVQKDASLIRMNTEIRECVIAIKARCKELGYTLDGMAVCGVSAGGTLAMNYAYTSADMSAVPVKFVFQLAGPAEFEPGDWDILKKVDKLDSDAEFLSLMSGADITDEIMKSGEYEKYVDMISPARLVRKDSVPTLIGYGMKDHLVPGKLKYKLLSALEENGVEHDYFEFPNCNHGMYRDPDVMKKFIDKSLEYCERYF
ncbi:MAG: alpha/beta hydrolase [Eubacteriales bacterium]|nr:alpha/beta hydrolase [Eubacteriales bacterium]